MATRPSMGEPKNDDPISLPSKIDMRKVKDFARKRLQSCPGLYEILLTEPDVLTIPQFIERLDVWLRLADAGAGAPE